MTTARVELITYMLAGAGASTYLEIGVSRGTTFRAVQAPTKLAVDPEFRFSVPWQARLRRAIGVRRGDLYFAVPSDKFFADYAARYLGADQLGVAFVDGLHEWRQARRDIENCVERLADDGAVIVHDCNPASASSAAATLAAAKVMPGFTGAWNGDVFKAIVWLRANRPDLSVEVLDCDHGLGVIRKTNAPGGAVVISDSEIESLEYGDLEHRRTELLGLRPPPPEIHVM